MHVGTIIALAFLLLGCSGQSQNRGQILHLVSNLYPAVAPNNILSKQSESDVWPCLLCLSNEELGDLFTPSLAADLRGNDTEKQTLGECFGYGPLAQGQDHNIRQFEVDFMNISNSQAEAIIRFQNFNVPNAIVFKFEKFSDQWKVSEFGSILELIKFCKRP